MIHWRATPRRQKTGRPGGAFVAVNGSRSGRINGFTFHQLLGHRNFEDAIACWFEYGWRFLYCRHVPHYRIGALEMGRYEGEACEEYIDRICGCRYWMDALVCNFS